MMRWALSDGTVVTSDGETIKVVGESEVADEMRYQLEYERNEILVDEPPLPNAMPLDPSRARNVDAWVERKARYREAPLDIVERPALEPLDLGPEDDRPVVY